jgi:hypothetical protein
MEHDIVPDTCVRDQGLGLSSLRDALTCCPSPKIRASRPSLVRRAEVSKEAVWVCGFKPAKALVRGLPLPRPPSF